MLQARRRTHVPQRVPCTPAATCTRHVRPGQRSRPRSAYLTMASRLMHMNISLTCLFMPHASPSMDAKLHTRFTMACVAQRTQRTHTAR